jgi:hypothetical protein
MVDTSFLEGMITPWTDYTTSHGHKQLNDATVRIAFTTGFYNVDKMRGSIGQYIVGKEH